MPHVRELASACERIASDTEQARQETRLGIAVTFHAMADGRIDWVMSCTHPTWPHAAHVIARRLWERAEVIEGRTPGVVHVLASS